MRLSASGARMGCTDRHAAGQPQHATPSDHRTSACCLNTAVCAPVLVFKLLVIPATTQRTHTCRQFGVDGRTSRGERCLRGMVLGEGARNIWGSTEGTCEPLHATQGPFRVVTGKVPLRRVPLLRWLKLREDGKHGRLLLRRDGLARHLRLRVVLRPAPGCAGAQSRRHERPRCLRQPPSDEIRAVRANRGTLHSPDGGLVLFGGALRGVVQAPEGVQ